MPIYGRFPPAVVDYRDVFHSSPVVFFEVQNYGHPYFPHEMRSQRTPKKCDNHMMALYYPHISPLCPHYIPLISATEPDDVGRLESFFFLLRPVMVRPRSKPMRWRCGTRKTSLMTRSAGKRLLDLLPGCEL